MAATDGRESDEYFEDVDVDEARARRSARRPRTGAKRAVMHAIGLIPSYIKLLFGLMTDSRVSRMDRLFVVAAAAYIISPLDFIPDFIPFLGEVDDIFLLMLALRRLVDNTGWRVLKDHWHGDPHDLSDINFSAIISAAGFFLPRSIKRKLSAMVGRKKQRA